MTTLTTKLTELGCTSETLDGIVDEAAGRIASRVNNEGMPEQLRFLENQVGMSEDEITNAILAELG